jgi:uncharacterized membrane protein
MNKTLLKDLDELVAAGIISPETSSKISDYYQHRQKDKPQSFPIVLAILGSLLVALGIVLLVAHNWDELPKTGKTIIAFLPLFLGQLLCFFTILKKKNSTAWRESSALILFFAIPTAISLISQIYQINGDLPTFLLTWLALGTGLVYIMNSSVVSLLAIAILSWYACSKGYSSFTSHPDQTPYLYLPGMAILAPFYHRLFTHKRTHAFSHLHNWFICASVLMVFGTFLNGLDEEWVFVAYLCLLSFLYLIGRSGFFSENHLYLPFRISGLAGIIILLMMCSYMHFWQYFFDKQTTITRLFYSPGAIMAFLMLAATPFLIKKLDGDDRMDPVNYAAFFFLFTMLVFVRVPSFATLLVNCYILVMGIYFTRKGAMRNHLGILNFGLSIVVILALMKFFDDSVPFVWRGVLFLAAGAGFIAANYLMIKKRKALTK